MQDRLENGLVIRVTGGEVWVDVGGEVVPCSLRGRLRMREEALQVVAGDHVAVLRDPSSGQAALERVDPRSSWLSRHDERGRGARAVVANVDCLFVVTALADPPLRPAFLDRVLAAASWGRVNACVVLNKTDLAGPGEVDAIGAVYRSCGYDVAGTCATTGEGVDALAERIGEGVYAFVGESGAGKTSLVNRLDPRLLLRVGDVGERTGRGRHTTSSSQLFQFRRGHLADTPGMQTFGFPGDDEHEVAECFPDIARVDTACRFDRCTHSHEPGCAVKAAVETGGIARSRHESYLGILAEVRERARRKTW